MDEGDPLHPLILSEEGKINNINQKKQNMTKKFDYIIIKNIGMFKASEYNN